MSHYVICTVPRTGSNLLAEALSSTGVAGRPLEYFNPDYRDFFLDRWKLPRTTSEPEFIQLAFRAGTTPNGTFGAKLQWFHLGRLTGDYGVVQLSSAAISRFLAYFPNAKYVFLTRDDKLRQAISWYRASYKNTWWAIDGIRDERSRTTEEPPFHFPSIKRCERLLHEHESAWLRLFSAIGVSPLRVEYSEVCADLQQVVRKMVEFVGARPRTEVQVGHPRLKKQADALTEEWVHACVTLERQARFSELASYGPNCET